MVNDDVDGLPTQIDQVSYFYLVFNSSVNGFGKNNYLQWNSWGDPWVMLFESLA